MFRQHGAIVLPLSEVVDNLMAVQQNNKRSHYLSTLIHAKWGWKELLRTTIFSMRNIVVPVVDGRITIPAGIENMFSVSYVDDCNNLVPLDYNPAINTLRLDVPESKCSCKKCGGEDTLCAMMDAIVYRTEDIVVEGQTLQKRIWNRTDPSGKLYEVTQTPVYDPATETVTYLETYSTVCEVELNEDGCLKKTPENELLITKHCGCYMISDCCKNSRTRVPSLASAYGSWNWEAGSGSVIHLRNVKTKSLIISAQTNEDCCGGEQLVPEFAVDALMFCIQYRQQAFAPSNVVPANAKEYSYRQYKRVKGDLLKYLHPIDMNGFMELGSIIPKWG